MSGGIAVATEGTTLRITLEGAVDLAVRESAAPVWAALAAGDQDVVLDCADVTFVDSTGLSLLVRLVRDVTESGRRVRVHGAPRAVTEILAVTGVDAWMRAQGVEGV
ncbi:lipid asymmetry maintenance protein MlaB [Cellulomonas algicola]|uniref:STAS domain-containing protein n=1 Tax=Cellulomonas algicola TaxID=2071633 RepID=UPI001C3FB9D9|nr:STAS domain-containing protein [Cellulomonas algicola]